MSNFAKKASIYGLSAVIGLGSLFGGFKVEPKSTDHIYNPTQVSQVETNPSRLENILKSVKFGPAEAQAKETGEYAAPSLEGYTFDKTSSLDKDEVKDGIKETTVEVYKNAAGTKYIMKYIAKDKVWAWNIYTPDKNDRANDYVLVDSDGDGKFDVRLSGTEPFSLPLYLK